MKTLQEHLNDSFVFELRSSKNKIEKEIDPALYDLTFVDIDGGDDLFVYTKKTKKISQITVGQVESGHQHYEFISDDEDYSITIPRSSWDASIYDDGDYVFSTSEELIKALYF